MHQIKKLAESDPHAASPVKPSTSPSALIPGAGNVSGSTTSLSSSITTSSSSTSQSSESLDKKESDMASIGGISSSTGATDDQRGSPTQM